MIVSVKSTLSKGLYLNNIKTIVYGGAFNPPTIAHQAILIACAKIAKQKNADLWLLPSGDRDDKQIHTDRPTRIEYLRAMIADSELSLNEVYINLLELYRDKATRTIDTVNELQNKYPNRLFIWVFGEDSVNTMPNWRGGKWMLDNLEMIIIKRRGYGGGGLAKNAIWLDVKTPVVCSTDVRTAIKKGETIASMVGAGVKSVIYKNQKRQLV
jgi:nicotinate-nucleotide adenylyltransferase